MNLSFFRRTGLPHFFILFCLWLVSFPDHGQAQIGIKIPKPPRVVTLFETEIFGLERIPIDSSLTITARPKSVKRSVTFDSTMTYVSFSEAVDKTEIVLPAVVDLETYIQLRLQFQTRELWKSTIVGSYKPEQEKEFGAIELDIPFKIKSKTFTRIFGSDRIGLRVTGNISFDLSGRTEERSGSAISAVESQNTFSPRFRQQQQFTVEGKIGDKVTVSVEQNSEAVTDIENTLKLRYDGDEDEIVQKIEAGNISLSLPSTKYVIFGGSNQGLFGLKTQMKMGNLHMTAIASLEKGQQQELSISGSSQSSRTVIKDTDFIKNQYFFIDHDFRNHYEKGFSDDNPQIFGYRPGEDIIQLDVFESITYTEGNARNGVALVNPVSLAPNGDYSNVNIDNIQNLDNLVSENKAYKGSFRRLEPEVDYTFDMYLGYLKLSNRIDDQKTLAIAYAVSNPDSPKVGTLYDDLADTNQAVILKLIKPKGMQPSDVDTWPLMMRNVYSLGGRDIEKEGFEIRLEYNDTGMNETRPEGNSNTFLNLLGLDVLTENGELIEGGDEIIDNNNYLVNRTEGILMFPTLQPFNPEEGSKYRGVLDEKYIVDMYTLSTSNTTEFQDQSKFEIVVNSSSTKSEFDLGFYVLEGSEVVTLGGVTLKRDTDYIIDYFSGKLTLLSSEAKRSSSNLNIKYERANLFQLDKKTIFGGRMEYQFWENSFIGLTALYLSKSTIDDRVRVGQEPFQNFVWDVNTALKFEPRFITRALDWLPLIETNAPSSINIEGEFAQVLPNPNTLNSSKTDDNDGVAYVDDFESAKRTTTLGIRYRTWTMSSPPIYVPNLDVTFIDSTVNKHRAHINWYNPYVQTQITDIWPNREVNARTGKYTDVLGIEFWRDENSDPDLSWVGMMRSTLSFADQLKTKYIEVWILGDAGTVNIDIGRISEDWYMEGKNFRGESSYHNLNTEDNNSNGLLDEGEDIGIDGIPDSEEDPGAPDDNWRQPEPVNNKYYNYDGINGTEGNSGSRDARYPDTEDLDGDGQLSTNNAYFEYSFSLDPDNPKYREDWIAGEQPTGWRLYRIPIKEPTYITTPAPDPNYQQIYNVRLWFNDLPTERTRIRIATFDFVGNEWEENGIAADDTSTFYRNDSLFTLATYNTEENPNIYNSPPGVTGTLDRITDTRSKEQSIVLKLVDFKAGQIAEAKKALYNAMELVNYKKMRMFVHGDEQLPIEPPTSEAEDSSQIQLYLRFGANASNYYEYGQDIYAGWNTKNNNIDIDLDELSAIKSNEDYNISSGETTIYLRKLNDKPGSYYKMVGNPSLKTIRYFLVGVKHLGNSSRRDSRDYTGEIWLDELRLSEVRKEKATALRISTALKLADVLTFNAQWESKDADFHNISTQFGEGSTNEVQNYSGKFTLDKFLPSSWDLSIPIDARATFSRSIPKYKHGSDELTGYHNNTIDKKLKSLFGLRDVPIELENEININETYGIGTTVNKRSKSKHWYIRYTLDEIVLDFDYSNKNSSNWEYLYNKSEQYKESFNYSIPFGKDNFFQPLKFVSNVPILKKISDQKLYYTPNTIKFALNVTDSDQRKLRRQIGDEVNEVSQLINTGTNRTVNTSYKMLNSLNFTYSRGWKSDADFDSLSHRDLWKSILTKFDFGLDTDINQSIKADYKPTLLDWLDPSFSYMNNFAYNLTNGNQFKQSLNRTQNTVNLNFSPSKLIKSIYTPKGVKKSSSPSRSRRSNRRTSQNDPENEDQDQQEDKKSVSVPNPLMWIYDFIGNWQSISVTYMVSNNVTNRYLTEMPSWQYQFGLTQDPGVSQDSSLLEQDIKLVGPQLQESWSLKLSTKINFTSNVKASFSYDRSKQESSTDYNTTRTGSMNSTYFVWGDDPQKDFNNLTTWRALIPDWTLQISGVEKILFFSNFAQNISIDHGHSSKYTESLSLNLEKEFKPQSQTFGNNWQPLARINFKTKWGVGGNVSMSSTENYNFSSAGGASKTATDQFSISMNYSKTAGFKIPLPIWPFKGKTFKNEINFNLTFDSSNNQTFQRQFGQDKFEEKQNNSNWKIRPSATYRFSKRIQGSLFYERGTQKNKITGKYTYNEFGITVNIAIRD